MKIIQILPHSLSPHNNTVDPRFYEDDWHVKVSKKIKKITNKYEIECWRPERNLKKIYTRTNHDGITYKIFPSKYFSKFEYSPSMLKELKKYLTNKEEVLLHFHGIIYPNTYFLLKSLPNEIPIVAQSHDASRTLIEAIFNKNPLKLLKPVESSLQKVYFKKIDQFFCLSKEETKEFSKYGSAFIQPMGIDFNHFKPIPKEKALKVSGLKNRKYILYVGRLDEKKGLKYLIKGFKESLSQHETILILVGEGPYKTELKSLINKLEISNYVKFLGFVENKKLPYLYNSVDATIFPSLKESYGIVPIESLACKTPLIATNTGAVTGITRHFRGGSRIIPLKDTDAIKNAINEMISGKIDKSYIDRENGKKYHDWNNIINDTLLIYDKLHEEYYG